MRRNEREGKKRGENQREELETKEKKSSRKRYRKAETKRNSGNSFSVFDIVYNKCLRLSICVRIKLHKCVCERERERKRERDRQTDRKRDRQKYGDRFVMSVGGLSLCHEALIWEIGERESEKVKEREGERKKERVRLKRK